MYKGLSQRKDSHRLDTTASLTGTSLCTYAIEPPCTERYARWCERSGLFSPSYSITIEAGCKECYNKIIRVNACIGLRPQEKSAKGETTP